MQMLTFRPLEQETLTVEQIAKHYPPPGWIETFKRAEKEIEHMSNVLEQLKVYHPPKLRIFRALDLCPLNKVRVVIIGQDPYPSSERGIPHANGLCFSTDIGLTVQNSLGNIYRELQREYINYVIPKHGDLTEWARQGVLLLNMCPTVTPNSAGSHKNYAIGFTSRILETLINQRKNHIYLLWGKQAQELKEMIGEKNVLMATHPSGLSAYRNSKDAIAFSECGHFKQVNDILISRGQQPINWQITVDPDVHKFKERISQEEDYFRYKMDEWLKTVEDKKAIKLQIMEILKNFETHIMNYLNMDDKLTISQKKEIENILIEKIGILNLQYIL